MTTSSFAVANAFITLAQEQQKTLTNMQVQKLVFLAQGYCLALFDKPIHYHNTHAWQFGPVIPRLYKALQQYGNGNVERQLDVKEEDDVISKDSREMKVVRAVFKAFGHYTAGQLSNLTHQPNTPWERTWKKERFSIIDNELMASFYKDLIKKFKN
ncbi:MAG: DUF4065 domain-containing protein [Methylophilaceae bacterium]|nr:DUF4065 domain-containing protein [Methylophilaceae bacterium]